jgi:hypothetical protein
VTILAAGACTVRASQAGGSNYHAASDVERSFDIAKAGSTTTVTAGDATYDGQPHGGTASVKGAGGLDRSLTVTYAGRGGTSYPSSTTAPTGAGAYTASATFDGDADHKPSSGSKDFTIGKATQTLTFAPLADKTFGDEDFTPAASASSGLAVSFAAAGNCAMSGGAVRITGAGSCTVTASQGGGQNYNAVDVARTFRIAKAATSTAVASAPNPSSPGQPVTLKAAVTSPAGTPTGGVTFRDNGSLIDGCENRPLSSGQAVCVTSTLGAAPHSLSADYSGDVNFLASTGMLPGGQVVGGVFEFAQAAYTVGERGGQLTITVRRGGDLSQAASVDYATDDGSAPSVAVPCSATAGAALERCDYTRSAGTLRFAPGESEKSFAVLVADDSFVEGPETTKLRLSNPAAGTVLGPVASATLEITDDVPESTGNPLDSDEAFVRQHYRDFLNREADAAGLAHWTGQMSNCGGANLEVCRINVSAAFFQSIEFQQTGFLVERAYKVAYGDAAGVSTFGGPHQLNVPAVRLSEFLPDAQELREGVVVGHGDWEARLEENKQAFLLGFVRRQRFRAAFPSDMSADEFVARLDLNAGGVLSAAERAELAATLGQSPSDDAKRAQALRSVAESAELRRRETGRALVLMQYFGYLRRDPNAAPDADHTGYDFWLRKLEEFGGDFVRAEMVRAFITSDEYRKRFGQ